MSQTMCQQSHTHAFQNPSLSLYQIEAQVGRTGGQGWACPLFSVTAVPLQVMLDLKTCWKSPTPPTFNSLLPQQPKRTTQRHFGTEELVGTNT